MTRQICQVSVEVFLSICIHYWVLWQTAFSGEGKIFFKWGSDQLFIIIFSNKIIWIVNFYNLAFLIFKVCIFQQAFTKLANVKTLLLTWSIYEYIINFLLSSKIICIHQYLNECYINLRSFNSGCTIHSTCHFIIKCRLSFVLNKKRTYTLWELKQSFSYFSYILNFISK